MNAWKGLALFRFSPPVILLVLLLASLGFKLFHAGQYPVYEDEVASILAAKGIVEHGVPIFPSGALYARDFLPHYLLSIPVALFGTGEWAVRSLSLIFSLVTLVGVYLLVSHLAGPWGGVAAAAILAFSDIEANYALSARMYMLFQMLTVLAAYTFIRGFIEGIRRYQWACILVMMGMLFTHKLAALILGVMAIYLLVRERLRLFRDPLIWTATFLLGSVCYFVYLYQFPNQVHPVTPQSWKGETIGTHIAFNGRAGVFYLAEVLGNFPGISLIFLAGFGWLLWRREQPLVFLYLLVCLPTLALSFGDYYTQNYLFNLIAVYVSAVCIVFVRFWRMAAEKLGAARQKRVEDTEVSSTPEISDRLTPIFHGVGTVLVAGYVLMLIIQDKPAYGIESDYKNLRPDEYPAHAYVKEHRAPGDIVITSNSAMTYYFLGDYDYFIRQRWTSDGGWGAFPMERDEYFGKPLIDTLPELQALLQNDTRIWLILDYKFRLTSGEEMREYLRRNIRFVFGKHRGSPILVGYYEKGSER